MNGWTVESRKKAKNAIQEMVFSLLFMALDTIFGILILS